MKNIDVSKFEKIANLLNHKFSLWLVVKSQDQLERRKRLLESSKRDRVGRIKERPVSEGLLVKVPLPGPENITSKTATDVQKFPEPRGFAKVSQDRYLIAEIDRVKLIDSRGQVFQEYSHPYFAFLHSVIFNPETERFLVVSSGFDSLIEMDLTTGKTTWEWFAWDHGFTTKDGAYIARNNEQYKKYTDQTDDLIQVDPNEYGKHGLLTSQRTNHPNSAAYHPDCNEKILATLGHNGNIIEIDKDKEDFVTRFDKLQSMPHNIMPHKNGWLVTDTMKGEALRLNDNWEITEKLIFNQLPGKVDSVGKLEWLQAVYPLGQDKYMGIDANREGLYVVDIQQKAYQYFFCDPNWCVHHLVFE